MKKSIGRWLATVTGQRSRLDEMLVILTIVGIGYIIGAFASWGESGFTAQVITYGFLGFFFTIPSAIGYQAELKRQYSKGVDAESCDMTVRRTLPHLLIGLSVYLSYWIITLFNAHDNIPVGLSGLMTAGGIICIAQIVIRLNLFKAGDNARQELAEIVKLLDQHSQEEALRLLTVQGE